MSTLMCPAPLSGQGLDLMRPRLAGLALVLLLHLLAAWLLITQMRPTPAAKPVLVPLTLSLQAPPKPARATQAGPFVMRRLPMPRTVENEVHPVSAPSALAAPAPIDKAQPATEPASPAPLNLALPARPASAPERHNPALSDPRANSPRPDAGARMAAALGSDPRLQEESLGGGRHRFRQGGSCVETAELRTQQLDPFNASMSVAPRLITSCK